MTDQFRLTKDLRVAFSVQTEAHGTARVYSMPVSRETFEDYFSELGSVFTECMGNDHAKRVVIVGPRIAYAALKRAARAAGTWETPNQPNAMTGVKDGLINELIRLTSVSLASEGHGWETLPLSTAVARGLVDDDTQAEILSSLVFFCAVSKAAPRSLAESLLPLMISSWGWWLGLSSNTEWIASLPTSTPAANTTKKRSSVIA